MPGHELVEPRGRPLLRPCWGRVGFASFLENVAPVELSPLAPRPDFRPLLLRGPTLQVRYYLTVGSVQFDWKLNQYQLLVGLL